MATQTEQTILTLSFLWPTGFTLWMQPSITKLDCQQHQQKMRAHCLFTAGSNEIIAIFTYTQLTQRKELQFFFFTYNL